jgi:hypothetical protein
MNAIRFYDDAGNVVERHPALSVCSVERGESDRATH